MQTKSGTLKFSEADGKFCIVNEANEEFIAELEFGDEFEVLYNEEWIPTCLQIISDDSGALVFKLKGTDFAGVLDGIPVRI